MRTTEILGSLAVAGAVATFAVLNLNQSPSSAATFLSQTEITEAEREFINFVSEYHRTYGTKEEYAYRLGVFTENYNQIKSHEAENGHKYCLGVNSLTDLSDYEYKQLLGYKSSQRQDKRVNNFIIGTESLPASVDWRDENAVTGVKNQGSCGSCWAFSTTGSLEGMNAIATGKLVSLSEQQLVDCSKKYGNLGCDGGLMDNAFKYVEDNGITTEAAYPYTGKGGSCEKFSVSVKNTGYSDVAANSPSQLQAAVARGPVSVAIEADKLVFQSYSSGIIDSTKCGTTLDHGVLVVGYGHDDDLKEDYWLLKNSWGVTWGEKGYFRILRSSTSGPGICGLQQEPSYPTV